MAQLTVTQVGIDAINAVGANGPKVDVTQYKLGSSFNYTPNTGQTALNGTELYTGTSVSYAAVSNQNFVYTLAIPDTVGDFEFGEVGLYLSTGELFAVATYVNKIQKFATDGQVVGNVILLDLPGTLANSTPNITFQSFVAALPLVPEIGTVELMASPASTASNLVHITGDDDVWSMRKKPGSLIWWPDNHTKILTSTVASSTENAISAAAITPKAGGIFRVQFTSGVHAGLWRTLNAVSTGQASWSTALTPAPVAGVSFNIYQYNNKPFSVVKKITELSNPATSDNVDFVSMYVKTPIEADSEVSALALKSQTRNGSDVWRFSNSVILENIGSSGEISCSAGSTTTSIVAQTTINGRPLPVGLALRLHHGIAAATSHDYLRKYYIQFVSGPLKGVTRSIGPNGNNLLISEQYPSGFVFPLPSAPSAGDIFVLFEVLTHAKEIQERYYRNANYCWDDESLEHAIWNVNSNNARSLLIMPRSHTSPNYTANITLDQPCTIVGLGQHNLTGQINIHGTSRIRNIYANSNIVKLYGAHTEVTGCTLRSVELNDHTIIIKNNRFYLNYSSGGSGANCVTVNSEAADSIIKNNYFSVQKSGGGVWELVVGVRVLSALNVTVSNNSFGLLSSVTGIRVSSCADLIISSNTFNVRSPSGRTSEAAMSIGQEGIAVSSPVILGNVANIGLPVSLGIQSHNAVYRANYPANPTTNQGTGTVIS
jgi:hypothetical protein